MQLNLAHQKKTSLCLVLRFGAQIEQMIAVIISNCRRPFLSRKSQTGENRDGRGVTDRDR